ncbi:hypothetical protein OsJ_06071 [Oryza sativa Japonica Group]|uniref:Uncharacterized protein n=1 Tax=Oryza sativa subsp. japonica TaxID=39947 RepID=B9F4S5_ORYSJ|nr:hypothetical protein OsJ_06071 [Oryza sativa Japonica Group]
MSDPPADSCDFAVHLVRTSGSAHAIFFAAVVASSSSTHHHRHLTLVLCCRFYADLKRPPWLRTHRLAAAATAAPAHKQ